MQVKAGNFTKSTGAATVSQSVTGVGFQPKVLFLWATQLTASGGGISGGIANSISEGISVSSSSYYSVGNAINSAGTTLARRITNKALCIINSAGTVIAECTLTSFDNDGFTLSWTTNDSNAYIIQYLCLGGSDLSNASLVTWTAATSTGNKSVTGAGFQPDLVYFLHGGGLTTIPSGSAGMGMGRGAMTPSGQNASAMYTNSALTRVDNAVVGAASGPAIGFLASYVSMDSDGFTVNFGTAAAGALQIIALCLKGGSYKVGSFTANTSTGAQSVTGVGFRPAGVILHGKGGVASTSAQGATIQLLGLLDSAGAEEAWHVNGSAWDAKTDKVYERQTGTIQSEADASSVDGDTFTINWSTKDATAYEIPYIAFGPYQTSATKDVSTAGATSTANTKDASTDAALSAPATKDIASDAALSTTATKDIASDAAVSATGTKDVASDASISTGTVVTLDLATAGVVSTTATKDLAEDAVVTMTGTLDLAEAAAVETTNTKDVATAAVVTTTNTKDVAEAAAIQTTNTKDVATAGVVTTTNTKDVTEDAILTTTGTKDIASDAVITAGTTVTLDLAEAAAVSVSLTSDGTPTLYTYVYRSTGQIGNDVAENAALSVAATKDLLMDASVGIFRVDVATAGVISMTATADLAFAGCISVGVTKASGSGTATFSRLPASGTATATRLTGGRASVSRLPTGRASTTRLTGGRASDTRPRGGGSANLGP